MLGALNIVVRTIAVNSRTQICKLGESIIPGLLFVWNNDPSDTLKVRIFLKVKTHLCILFMENKWKEKLFHFIAKLIMA